MITFSVNPSGVDKDKLKGFNKLMSQVNKYNRAYVGAAYIQLITGQTNNINLESFLRGYKKAEKRIAAECNSLDDEGERAFQIPSSVDFESEVIAHVCEDFYVEQFLELREYLFFKEGYDIWRGICLTLKGDARASKRVREVCEVYDCVDFMKEFCSDINCVYAVAKILN